MLSLLLGCGLVLGRPEPPLAPWAFIPSARAGAVGFHRPARGEEPKRLARGEEPKRLARGEEPKRPPVGVIPPGLSALRLKDAAGREVSPAAWKKDKAIVLFCAGLECPVANFYAPQIEALAKEYAGKGVRVIGVYAEPDVSPEEVRNHAADYKVSFAQWLDPEQKLAELYGLKTIAEVAVVAGDGRLVYRGRIDDRYALDQGKRRDEPRTRELVDAVEAVLAGRAPAVKEAPAYGCPLPKQRLPPDRRD